MKLRDLIWPWSTIRRLQKQLDLEREFGDTCLLYLNDHDGKTLDIQFIRFNGKLYCMGIDYCNEIVPVPNPRTNWKVEGIQ